MDTGEIIIASIVIFLTIMIPLGIPLIGIIFGRINEKRHFRQLDLADAEYSDIFVTQLKTFPEMATNSKPPQMLVAEVVIATDWMKSFVAGIVNLFGGEIKAYQRMQERARREALVRLQSQARELGYNGLCNLRIDTAAISGGAASSTKKNAIVVAPIIASATAYDTVR